MTDDNKRFESAIIEIVAQLSSVRADTIKHEHRLREDLGLDSVSSMELLSMLAERFNIDIGIEEAMDVTTVGAVIEMGKSRLKKDGP